MNKDALEAAARYRAHLDRIGAHADAWLAAKAVVRAYRNRDSLDWRDETLMAVDALSAAMPEDLS